MKVKYIRRDVPEEISESGGAFIQLVDKTTVGLVSSIKEAIAQLYCVGEASMIEGYFTGLMRSVFEGIRADGCARNVGDIRFYPVCGGTFDLTKGWDPDVNDVRIKAQLVNGVTLDVSDWSFEDATEGRVSFAINSISDGTTKGVVSSNKNVEINGKDFPASADLTIAWACNGKSGTVDAAKFTSDVSRITIDKTAFATLGSTDNGKEIEFVVKGCYNKVTKTALFNFVETVIAQTTDGTVKVNTFTDNEQTATFEDGHEWDAKGSGFSTTMSSEAWWINDCKIRLTADAETTYGCTFTRSSDKLLKLERDIAETVPAGTYPNARVEINLIKGESNEKLILPMNYHVL